MCIPARTLVVHVSSVRHRTFKCALCFVDCVFVCLNAVLCTEWGRCLWFLWCAVSDFAITAFAVVLFLVNGAKRTLGPGHCIIIWAFVSVYVYLAAYYRFCGFDKNLLLGVIIIDLLIVIMYEWWQHRCPYSWRSNHLFCLFVQNRRSNNL